MSNEKEEEWKLYDEKGLKNKFLVSEKGNVKSINPVNPEKKRLLKGYKNAGYPCIPTRLEDGKNTLRYIHKIVANLYVPNPNKYERVIHIDGNKSNAAAANLKWVDTMTFNENQKKLARLKYTPPKGVARNAKLTEAQVRVLKRKIFDPNRKTRYKILAKQFDISLGTIFAIKRGDRWKDVKY